MSCLNCSKDAKDKCGYCLEYICSDCSDWCDECKPVRGCGCGDPDHDCEYYIRSKGKYVPVCKAGVGCAKDYTHYHNSCMIHSTDYNNDIDSDDDEITQLRKRIEKLEKTVEFLSEHFIE